VRVLRVPFSLLVLEVSDSPLLLFFLSIVFLGPGDGSLAKPQLGFGDLAGRLTACVCVCVCVFSFVAASFK
jgi:hypothetical protein